VKLTPDKYSTLLTSAGRRVELVRAFRRAYEGLRLPGNVIAVDHDPLAPSLHAADRSYIVPAMDSPEYIPGLLKICRDERVRLIFPLIDPDIAVLAAHRHELEADGACLASVPSEAASMTADKWETLEFFRSLGLKTPASWKTQNEVPDDTAFPLFIKPRFGSAGKNTFKVNTRRELEFFAGYVVDPIIQEFLPGPEITNDVICDLDQGVLAVISRRRIEVRWGEVAKGVTLYDPQIEDACVKVAKGLGARGPITVQCLMKDGVPHFSEINARLGGGAPLGIAAGADWPLWLIAKAAAIPVDVPPLGTFKRPLFMTRYDDSFFLEREDIERIPSPLIRP
jgi:carbamoyl-phosphate synthase large subunit